MNIITQFLNFVYQKVIKKSSKTKDTGPERAYERLLKKQGLRMNKDYFKQCPVGRCHVDFYIKPWNTLVEVNGCYPHCCKKCGFNTESYGIPAKQKRLQDFRRMLFLQSQGYEVKVVWQHDLFKKKTQHQGGK